MTILEAIWLIPVILFSFVGMGSIYNTAYMRWFYVEPADNRDVEIEYLESRIADVTRTNLNLEKDNDNLLKAILKNLTT